MFVVKKRPPVRRLSPVIFLTLLAGLTLSGCLDNQSPNPITIPREGDFWVYESADGSMVQAVYAGITERANSTGDLKQVHIISYRVNFASDEAREFLFEEAIDVHSGRIVQQVGYCGDWLELTDSAGERRSYCLDRGVVVWAAEGMPGALGAAPYWGRPLPDPSGCWVEERRLGAIRGIFLLAGDTVEVCPGSPFPAKVRLALRPNYQALEHDHGHPANLTLVDSGRTDVVPPLAGKPFEKPGMRQWSGFFPADDLPVPFATDEAHEQALERSTEYRQLFATANVKVIRSIVSQAGESGNRLPVVGYEEETWSRKLTAADPTGAAVNVTVLKKIRTSWNGEVDVEYELRESAYTNWSYAGTLGDREYVSLEGAADLASRLTEHPKRFSISGYTLERRPVTWMEWRPSAHENSFDLVLHLQEKGPERCLERLSCPYRVTVDGESGRMIEAVVPSYRLPV